MTGDKDIKNIIANINKDCTLNKGLFMDLSGSLNTIIGAKQSWQLLPFTENNTSAIGQLVSPHLTYHATFFLVNEITQSIVRAGVKQYSMMMAANGIIAADVDMHNKKPLTFKSFAHEYLIDQNGSVSEPSKDRRNYNMHVNCYNTRVTLRTIIECLNFVSTHDEMIIKLPTISCKVIDDLLAIFLKSFSTVVIYKTPNDSWTMDSFYVLLANKKDETPDLDTTIRNSKTLSTNHKDIDEDEKDKLCTSLVVTSSYIDTPYYSMYRQFKMNMQAKIFPELIRVRNCAPSKASD